MNENRKLFFLLIGLWISYSGLYEYFIFYHASYMAGILSLVGESGLDFIAAMMTYSLLKKSTGINKYFFTLMFISFIAAFVADTVYNVLMNIIKINITPLLDSLFDIPFIIFLFFQALAWLVLFRKNSQLKKVDLVHYIPYLFSSTIIFCTFIFGFSWKISHSSLVGFYQIADTLFEAIGFVFASFCLSRTKETWLKYLIIGYLLIISSDFIIRYGVVENAFVPENIMELTWILGLLFVVFGLSLIRDKNFSQVAILSDINSLQSQATIWIFTALLISILLITFLSVLTTFLDSNTAIIKFNQIPTLLVLSSIASILLSTSVANRLYLFINEMKKIIDGFDEPISNNSCLNMNAQGVFIKNNISEFDELKNFFVSSIELKREKYLGEKKLIDLAAQVAHDIRSPLAVLEMVVQTTDNLPEDKRVLVRSAAGRIRDIANNLLESKRPTPNSTDEALHQEEPLTRQLASSLIGSVVTEKRLQFRSKIGITIEDLLQNTDSYGLFIKVQASNFKRIISNLINNAVEAMTDTGKVTLSLKPIGDLIELIIQDTGKGIPSEIIKKLGQEGISYNKSEGNGLGLFHAKQALFQCNGKLIIGSEVGKGTTIKITLPKSYPPKWFISMLTIYPETIICIIDDDDSIHQIWKKRFSTSVLPETHHDLKIYHFSCPHDLKKWHTEQSDLIQQQVLYLCDHEFIGVNTNGLDLIQQLNIGQQSVLITSHYEEKAVQERCEQLQTKLIPKSMAAFVPLVFSVNLVYQTAII